MYVCPIACLKNHIPKLHEISTVTVVRSSDDNAKNFGFVDDIMFSPNGANGAE